MKHTIGKVIFCGCIKLVVYLNISRITSESGNLECKETMF